MARRKADRIPNYKERQKILYIYKTPPGELLQIADELLEKGRFSEAYDYIERAGDENRLRSSLEQALEKGDFFNFDRAARRLDIEVADNEWEELGDNAVSKELYRHAVNAYRRSGNRPKAEAIMQAHPDLFGPAPLMEKERLLSEGEEEEREKKGIKGKKPPEAIPRKTQPPTPPPENKPVDPEAAARARAEKARKKKWKKKKKR